MIAVVMMARFSTSSEDGGQTEGQRASLEERNGRRQPRDHPPPGPWPGIALVLAHPGLYPKLSTVQGSLMIVAEAKLSFTSENTPHHQET